MGKTILYERVGDQYIPVREHDPAVMDTFAEGYYLLHVKPGIRSIRSQVNPDYIGLLAASLDVEDQIVRMLLSAAEPKPSITPLTAEQKVAWENLIESFRSELYLKYPAYADIARNVCTVLVEHAVNIMSDESKAETIAYIRSMAELLKNK